MKIYILFLYRKDERQFPSFSVLKIVWERHETQSTEKEIKLSIFFSIHYNRSEENFYIFVPLETHFFYDTRVWYGRIENILFCNNLQ